MSQSSSRARRAAKPLRVSPLLSMYVPTLRPAADPAPESVRVPLLSRSWFGVTLYRYSDGCEIVYADGRKAAARGPLGLLAKILTGGAK